MFPVISIRCRLAHRPIPFLLLGSLGIGKRCFESRNNNTCSNPFIDGFLVLSKAQQGVLRVTRRLFGYCRKVAAARYVSSYSKPFGLLPKTLPPGCLSEVGQPVQTCGVPILFLVLYAVQSYLVVKRGTPDAEQCRRQRAVAFACSKAWMICFFSISFSPNRSLENRAFILREIRHDYGNN